MSHASEINPLSAVSAAIIVAMGITNPKGKLPVALIAGPTASGKTAMSLFLAAQQDCVIINADSAQVYADIPVLSAQPTAQEKASAPHHLFGYLDGIRPCSAADWARDASCEIALAHAAGKLPILVGGTGLYLRTLLDGIAPVPEIDPSVRRDVRAMSTEAAYGALGVSDPEIAFRLHANDDSRIKRALEVIQSTGRSLLDWRSQKVGGILESIELMPLLLLPPRQWLHARCDLRFLAMIEKGAIDEVRTLIDRGLPRDAPLMRAIGVPEIAAMLAGEISIDAAIERGQAATRQYAKRQYTWFRNQTPDSWLRIEEEINDSTTAKIVTLFQRM
jgi:tRNA dimethylallyltransferase